MFYKYWNWITKQTLSTAVEKNNSFYRKNFPEGTDSGSKSERGRWGRHKWGGYLLITISIKTTVFYYSVPY